MTERSLEIYGIKLLGDEKIRYVGLTTKGAAQRFKRHITDHQNPELVKRPLYQWINKHGADQLEVVTLEVCHTVEELDAAEQHWIEKLQTHVSHGNGGLNVLTGGCAGLGYVASSEARSKISDALRGKKFSDAHRAALSEAFRNSENRPKHSSETITKMSSAQKAKPNRGAHTWWHVRREQFNSSCLFCTEELSDSWKPTDDTVS